MEVNILAVIIATIVMFAVGAVWYMGLFAKKWGEMHGFDHLSKTQQQEMSSKMAPFYGLQLLMTLISAFVLAHFITLNPSVEYYKIAFWVWLGFMLPAIVSGVIFGGTKSENIVPKILIQAGEALVRLMVAAFVICQF